MKYVTILILFSSLLLANNNYCISSDINENPTILSYRDSYNIGETISEEDQVNPHSVCHSNGSYDTGSIFKFSDYSGDIILISMNATW